MPAHHHNADGRNRDTKMTPDINIPCRQPKNRRAFDTVIDLTNNGNPDSPNLMRAIRAAKEACGGCNFQIECFRVHGADLELGVVAGLTDSERAQILNGGAA